MKKTFSNQFLASIVTPFILLFSQNGLASSVPAQALPGNLTGVLQQTMPAVVFIQAEGDEKVDQRPFRQEGSPMQPPAGNNQVPPSPDDQSGHFVSLGSGVIVDANKGYILTNAHVVYQADNVTITLNDGRRYKARLIGADTGFDIAIIQISARNLKALPFGDSDQLKVGDFVTAIGSPFTLRQTVTSGIISGLHRSIHLEGNEDFIQTDASINMGSSGGALINAKGELVGLNTAILAPSGGNVGIGFAIPINLAHSVMAQLLKYDHLERGLLGILIQNLNPDLASSLNAGDVEGALVSQVNPGSPGASAGLNEGDVITAVDGHPITTSAELVNLVSLKRPGTTIALAVIRNGSHENLRATLTSAKAYKEKQNDLNNNPLSGVSLTDFDQITLNYGHIKGVQAVFVDPNSDAWSGMLRPGDVITSINQKKITTMQELQQALNKGANNEHLLLHVLREDGGFYLTIP